MLPAVVLLYAVQAVVGQSPEGGEGGVVVTSFQGGASTVTNLQGTTAWDYIVLHCIRL